MQKACLPIFLAIPLLGAPDDVAAPGPSLPTTQVLSQTKQPESRYGWFFGAGLNASADRVEYRRFTRETFPTAGLGAKIGGYAYLNSWLLARSYFGYDIDLNWLHNEENVFNPPINGDTNGDQRHYLLYQTYSLNFDLIFNVYTTQKVDVGLILGGEFNLVNINFNARAENSYVRENGEYYRRFTTKIKLGARVMFGENKKYGIELIEKIGQNLQTTFGHHLATDGNNFGTTIHFVMEM